MHFTGVWGTQETPRGSELPSAWQWLPSFQMGALSCVGGGRQELALEGRRGGVPRRRQAALVVNSPGDASPELSALVYKRMIFF